MTDLNEVRAGGGCKLPLLDRRLRTAAQMAGNFRTFADIGADHGQLSTVLLAEDENRLAIVSDISEKALCHARNCLMQHGLDGRAEIFQADGLVALKKATFEPQVIFILGMGGETIRSILKEGAGMLRTSTLVLGAHTEIEPLRQTLCELEYSLTDENFLVEKGHHYVLMRADASLQPVGYTPKQIYLGPILMKKPTEEWIKRLKRRGQILLAETRGMRNGTLSDEKQIVLRQKLQELQWITEMTESCPEDMEHDRE